MEVTVNLIYADHVDPRTVTAKHLVIAIGGAGDAGGAVDGLSRELAGEAGRPIGSFPTDEVANYLRHRPRITMTGGWLADYRPPTLTLHEGRDAEGDRFLVLSGPEPGLNWEKLADSVVSLVDRFMVEQVTVVMAVPMGVPHTRAITATLFASDQTMLPDHPELPWDVSMPASFPVMLGLRLEEAQVPVAGVALHVPHYLAEQDYPAAAMAGVDWVARLTNLKVSPTAELTEKDAAFAMMISQALQQNPPFAAMVGKLEAAYDEPGQPQLGVAAGQAGVPSAEEIGAEAEQFLRDLNQGEGTD
ncbi:hypothetical protein CGZ92_09105 [Parenemella sanctibonifatiensis]|uniref:PAC2 family protein n=1 Tax=Parenemella sanctibonifatiensis TaxID=2016505 RepID=A0A255E4L7_9ACTN|nr:hypothetical protein CGZ92_09105 [Parenemella sanctibonifatiensis]